MAEIKEEVIMTKLGQMIFDDGVKQGKERGERAGRDGMTRLIAILLKENRNDDLERITKDEEYRDTKSHQNLCFNTNSDGIIY